MYLFQKPSYFFSLIFALFSDFIVQCTGWLRWMDRILDDKCGFLQSVWFQISPKSLKSCNLKIQCIHLRHPVKYIIHTYYTHVCPDFLMTPIWEVFHKMWKQRQHGEHWTHFYSCFQAGGRSVLRTLRALRLVAFPGEKPNETFSRCSSNNLHTWFPTKVR